MQQESAQAAWILVSSLSVRLGFNPWVIVAARGYLAQHGTPKRIRHFG